MFYVSADTKSFAPVMSAINGAIEVAELASKQQAMVETAAMSWKKNWLHLWNFRQKVLWAVR